ncbi:hypothetical protein H5410_027960 [Solanum commersonii]|uniref:Transposase, Ptta/En/Spm, plant n=1 Tax=Solanum commersonii TaxID=4109 RepID=A0A9J5Z4V9_SOLCO|nr:hypothetical protein H5410_027960 [Solanum commersonii]
MSQSAALKKKGSNPNKAQSPLKNLNFDMQYRSSTELANQFKIKREQLANERNDKAKKEHAPIAHKRKNSEDFIPQQGKSKLLEYKSVIHSSSREELGEEKVGLLATSSNQFLEEQRLQKEHDIHDLPNCKQVKRKSVIPATKEICGDECAIDEEIGIDCGSKGILEPKKVRGKITCKDIHARNLEERKKVTFDKGQAVGPTGKIVSELTNFIGTISRNSRFINLMYTSWHAVPKDTKKSMWEYINDMLAKRPDDMPEEQFRQLIKYWKHPTVQRATKENNEEPSKSEMFIATRTKTRKDLHTDTQVAIAELQNRQNSGETTDDAFTAVFRKKQPGRIRCYGRSVTTSSLKKDEETNELKQKHANEITSLKEEMNEMREEMQHFFSQLLQNNPGLNVRDMPGCVRSNIASPINASSA